MTQLWPEGAAIEVETANQQPRAFHWQWRRSVCAVVDQWIIHDEWWRHRGPGLDAAGQGGEIWRHYFQVETTDGLLCVLYHDLTAGAWFLERVYD